MALTKEEWETSITRLEVAANRADCKCQILLTSGVGGEAEGAVITGEHDKERSGKML